MDIEKKIIKYSLLFSLFIAANMTIIEWRFLRDSVEFISIISKHYLFLGIAACLMVEMGNALRSFLHQPAQQSALINQQNKI